MSGYGLRLQARNGHLCAEWGIGRDRHKACLSRVSRDLKRVIVVGSGGFATFDAINWITDIGASLIFLDRRGKFQFASTPTAPSDVRLRRAQCLALGNGTALNISRELISQKIDGQAAIVRGMLGSSVAADAILQFKAELAETNDTDAVRLVEAQAAKMYWSRWANVPIRWPRKDEIRVPAHWKRFMSRISSITHSPRLATNPANACMNLIHALCEAECRIALISTGLDPEIGLLHRDASNRSSLANDLQEVLRPAVDSFVLNWIQTEPFRKADFWEDKNGNCRLMSHLCAKLAETAPTWGKLVAPWAEYVARTLWASTSPSKSERRLSTPLTQQHRREAKGRPSFPRIEAPTTDRLCRGCGKTIERRHAACSDCAKAVATDRFASVSKLGRIAARSPEARAKHVASHLRHTKANSAWDASKQPAWLTDQLFSEKIQPLLAQASPSEIAKRIGVSRWYAGRIREGYRPHPRHWQGLAVLVGASPQAVTVP
jgi:CRISPR-associated endonuclease Cas1